MLRLEAGGLPWGWSRRIGIDFLLNMMFFSIVVWWVICKARRVVQVFPRHSEGSHLNGLDSDAGHVRWLRLGDSLAEDIVLSFREVVSRN